MENLNYYYYHICHRNSNFTSFLIVNPVMKNDINVVVWFVWVLESVEKEMLIYAYGRKKETAAKVRKYSVRFSGIQITLVMLLCDIRG